MLAASRKVGVVAVPNVVFYDNEVEGQHLIRFTFCKSLDVLDEGDQTPRSPMSLKIAAVQHDIVWKTLRTSNV